MVSSAWTRGGHSRAKGQSGMCIWGRRWEGQIIIDDMVPYYVMVSLSGYLAGEKNGQIHGSTIVRLDVSGSGGSGNKSIAIHG